MLSVKEAIQNNATARTLAQAVLAEYFQDRPLAYPINPFQMLTDMNVPFVFRTFSDKKLEGVYLPAQNSGDIAIIGINIKRPITRQRFTAAHELCHHIKDSRSSQICTSRSDSLIERYAESFAAELLMPYSEMKRQIQHYAPQGYLSSDDVLSIAEYFGVSFTACLNRVAYTFHKIDGDTSSKALSKRAEKFHAETRREALGYTHTVLYKQLLDAGEKNFRLTPIDFIKSKYRNSYVYNDSRLEGIDLEKSKVAEIVTDIRLHGADSPYCTEDHKPEIEVAGHAIMCEYLFSLPPDKPVDLFTIVPFHRQLFSCAPAPEFGGQFRTSNTLVVGAKFETIDHTKVIPALLELEPIVRELLSHIYDIPFGEYVEKLIVLHHKLTVIHPFGDGNGRTLRAFLNLLLMRRGLLPIYIKVEEKTEYEDALAKADMDGTYDKLYAVVARAILRSQVELSEAPPL